MSARDKVPSPDALDGTLQAERPKAAADTDSGIEATLLQGTPAPTPTGGPAISQDRTRDSFFGTRRGTLAATTYSTPLETMRIDEAMRMRMFIRVSIVILVCGGLIAQTMGGNPFVRLLFFPVTAAAAIISAGFLYYIRDPSRYTPMKGLIPAAITIAAADLACWFFGLFSTAEMLFVLGIYFFCLGSSRLAAFLCYLFIAVVQGVSMLLVAFEVLPDTGLIPSTTMSPWQKIALTVLVEMIFLLTYLFARISYKTTLKAVEGLGDAIRRMSQQQAMLQEANQDLEKALGGGGRWTGETVGDWQIGDLIGRGAMGEIYRAHSEPRNQVAAIKILFPHVQAEPQRLQRFLREADIMAKINSRHIATVYDVSDGTKLVPYIAMELLAGNDLAWHLRKRRRLGVTATASMISEVCAALEHAHGENIVHRDLKPQNIFLSEKGRQRTWMVLDFGISKIGSKAETLTRSHVIGTPAYMAPEQANSTDIDPRADIFSLGIVAYRALTGRLPFSGDTHPEIMFHLVYSQPAQPSHLVSVSEDIDSVLAIALAKKREQRFATATELADALGAASHDALAPELRERARAILQASPWGRRAK